MAVRFEMPVHIVNSKQNARLKELRRAMRSPERDSAVIGIEGPHLLEEAVRAGLKIRCVFTSERFFGDSEGLWYPTLATEKNRQDGARKVEVLIFPAATLSSVLETETPQPVAALVEPPQWSWSEVLGSRNASLLVVLAGVQDPGNLGTVLRSAEAFGANGVVSLPGTVSPWNQKAMRASAGSVFRLPVIQAGVDECFLRFREAGLRVLTTSAQEAMAADTVDLTTPIALLIGNEGNGVPDEIAARADAAITIPCPGPVESLNASVAASVLLYEASRQRRTATRAPRSKS
jgi:TrmH family RNA methyltransferase